MPSETLTISQYAKKIKKSSRQSVLKAIKDCEKGKDKWKLLPSVVTYKKIGCYYLLEVSI